MIPYFFNNVHIFMYIGLYGSLFLWLLINCSYIYDIGLHIRATLHIGPGPIPRISSFLVYQLKSIYSRMILILTINAIIFFSSSTKYCLEHVRLKCNMNFVVLALSFPNKHAQFWPNPLMSFVTQTEDETWFWGL